MRDQNGAPEPPALRSSRFALAQTCRQLRQEYLTICWNGARLAVRWRDALAFFNTFYTPDERHIITNIHRAPQRLTVLVGAFHVAGPILEILPFVQMSLITRTTCFFDIDYSSVTTTRDRDLAEEDCNTMHSFLACRVKQWRLDVTSGKLRSIKWKRNYLPARPRARVWVQFKEPFAPQDWAVMAGHYCPKYLAMTVFAHLSEADRFDLQQTFGCKFSVTV
ncbi:uncharacterized protein N0V89_008998 [Didymosphaeria variabile]|uniref:Uncharacterized protein n=1 Tax=Didymosphaeria variabile TaxID=1932322 RepID=A0A9W9C9T4_9PLEO|nr:uncharacterized protein N0V89_008998 [Didymosphaeria variabile]KAJ4350377.1 hypothetical protein N0V89_008998 [Didymosphaeria variabile]